MNFGDIVLCSTNARFKYPFAQLGLTPELSSSYILPFLVGFPKAKELIYFGDWFSADDALRLNLVNRVVSPDELMPLAKKLASRLAKNHPENMRLIKKVMNSYVRKDLDDILEEESKVMKDSLSVSIELLIKMRESMKKKSEGKNKKRSKL